MILQHKTKNPRVWSGQSHLNRDKNGNRGGETIPKKPLEAIEEHFNKVIDPRKDQTKDHKLIDIIAIAICVVICGAEGWVDIELFSKSKLHWLILWAR